MQCYNGMYCVQHVSSTGAETEGLRSPGLISSHPISDKGPHLTISDKGPAHHLRQGTEMLSSESISNLFIAPRPESAWPTYSHRSDEIFTATLWPSHRRSSHCTTIMVISWRHRNNCRTIWINVISHTGQMCRFSLIVEFSGVWAVPLKYMYTFFWGTIWIVSHQSSQVGARGTLERINQSHGMSLRCLSCVWSLQPLKQARKPRLR